MGDWALGWTEGNERLQIIFVMMLFPLIMNALQYYIIDSYIKKDEKIPEDGAESEGLVTGRGDAEAAGAEQRGRGRGSRGGVYDIISASDDDAGSSRDGDSDGDEEEDEDELPKDKAAELVIGHKKRGFKTRTKAVREEEYDPAVDGDTPTVIGSSSSAVSGVSVKD